MKPLHYYHLLLDYLIVPKNRLDKTYFQTAPQHWLKGNKGNIILIHGWGGRWNYFYPLGEYVNKLGFKVHVLEKLGYNTLPISICSEILENYIVENELKNVTLICHSKGGLIARYFLANSKHHNLISRIITIATPHKGTVLAHAGIFNTSEMVPSSKLIRSLNKSHNKNLEFINLYPAADNVIIPNKNLLLDGATNIEIDTVGHLSILHSQQLMATIKKILINNENVKTSETKPTFKNIIQDK